MLGGVGDGVGLTPVFLVTKKNGVELGVGLGDGVGDGVGYCGTAAGYTLMSSPEIVEALSEEVGVGSAAMEDGLVALFHVRFLI